MITSSQWGLATIVPHPNISASYFLKQCLKSFVNRIHTDVCFVIIQWRHRSWRAASTLNIFCVHFNDVICSICCSFGWFWYILSTDVTLLTLRDVSFLRFAWFSVLGILLAVVWWHTSVRMPLQSIKTRVKTWRDLKLNKELCSCVLHCFRSKQWRWLECWRRCR